MNDLGGDYMGDTSGPLLRRLPHSVDAEMALLGAILINNRCMDRVSEFLRPEHFILADHAAIFGACAQMIDSGHVADPVTLTTRFDQGGELQSVGGVQYLIRLADSAVTANTAGDYGRMVRDLHLRRELIAIGEHITNQAYGGDSVSDVDGQIEDAEASLFALADRGTGLGQEAVHISASFNEAFRLADISIRCRAQGELPGISTGIRDIDDLTLGLQRGDLTIIAGRPSAGKTELAGNIALNVAKAYRETRTDGGARTVTSGGVVAFFSLEMRHHQLAQRIQARASRIGAYQLRSGTIKQAQLADAIAETSAQFGCVPLYIDDRAALTIAAVRAQCRRIKRKHGLHVVIIDYLQLLNPPQALMSSPPVVQIGAITKGLKALAKELDVAVVCLSQLSRAVEQRDDKRPQLSDLRDGGTIEQDADNVAFVFRESYYMERSEPTRRSSEKENKFQERLADWQQRLEACRNVMEVTYAKQRMGPTRNVKLYCDLQLSFIGDLERGR